MSVARNAPTPDMSSLQSSEGRRLDAEIPAPPECAIEATKQPPLWSYRQDRQVPAFPDDLPLIVFDGCCVMCSGWARFVLRHDQRRRFRFAPAQSPLGRALLLHYGLPADDFETHLLLQDGTAYFRSEAGIRMAEGLGWPWSLAACLRILPLRVRDALYGVLARNRLRLFGRRDACFLPEGDERTRFLA